MLIDVFKIGPVTVHGYGLMIAIGIVCAVFMAMKRADKYGLIGDELFNMAMIGIIFGFVGSKLLYIIVEFKQFLADPISIIGTSGFVVYGGIIAGVVAAIVYGKIKKLPWIDYVDMATPSIALGQAFGRIGCFLAGCCYGKETTLPIGVVFPANSFAPSGVRLIPTQLISSAGDFAICAILLLFARKKPISGSVTALYMILYSVGRFSIEFLRADNRGNVSFLSTSQFISIFVALAAGVMFVFLLKKKKEE